MKFHVKYALLALPVLLAAGVLVATASAQESGTLRQDSTRKEDAGARKARSRLVLGKPALSPDRILSFPIHFTAAAGATVGTIRAELIMPQGAKFRKIDLRAGSRIKASAKQVKRDEKGNKHGGESMLELTLSGGIHAIPDGLLGTLQFSMKRPEAPTEIPVVRILSTSPPETEQVGPPGERAPDLPSGPAPNPAVSCFFFSH